MDTTEYLNILSNISTQLNNQKDIYDYLIIILPVITGILGWFFSAAWQTHQWKLNNLKEQYYNIRHKIEEIINDYNELLNYTYEFYKYIKNRLNSFNIELINEDHLNDFVTNFQFKLSKIHQIQKLYFPRESFDETKKINISINELVKNIQEMKKIIISIKENNLDDNSIKYYNCRVDQINKKNKEIIDRTTEQVGIVENRLVNISNKKANKIGINK